MSRWLGGCRASIIMMALLMDDSIGVLEKWGEIPIYWRRALRVSLGYTTCTTNNVQVLSRCNSTDFHAVPRISIGVVFHG